MVFSPQHTYTSIHHRNSLFPKQMLAQKILEAPNGHMKPSNPLELEGRKSENTFSDCLALLPSDIFLNVAERPLGSLWKTRKNPKVK
jgi:hypothetical protein